MPDAVAPECRTVPRFGGKFGILYIAMILLSLHWAVVVYMNSSFLEQFISDATIGILYVVSALLTIVFFFSMSRVLSRTGKHALVLILSIIEIFAVTGLGFLKDPAILLTLFVVHQTIIPLILFNLDIYMEELIGDQESGTGARRGMLLTIMSLGGAIAPLIAGYLIGTETPHFEYAYLGSALLMIPFIFIMATQFSTRGYQESPVSLKTHALVRFWKEKDLRNVFGAHFLLQLFFAWMVIYSPLYLATQIGFNWTQIGQILFVGLFAYVLFEYSIGVVVDKWIGEKELMALGFLIIAVSTSWFIFMTEPSLIGWMLIMFLTRVGASLVEVTTESYFFKHTQGNDAEVISFFRATRPLSYVIGAGLASVVLYFTNFNMLFLVLAGLMIPGFFFAMALHDTK